MVGEKGKQRDAMKFSDLGSNLHAVVCWAGSEERTTTVEEREAARGTRRRCSPSAAASSMRRHKQPPFLFQLWTG